MSVSIQGTPGGNAGATVTIPTHAAGDIIILSAFRASNTPASVPAAGGTVPTWLTIETGGLNTLSLITVYCIATANNHTSGTFTNATQMTAIVLRGTRALSLGTHSTGNANNTQTIVYPALTLTRTNSTSFGVRVGCRATADSEVGTNAPSGAQAWTNQVTQPAGASALMGVFTAATLAANPTADTVNTTGTNAAYRAHTIEILEAQAYTLAIGSGSFGLTGSTVALVHGHPLAIGSGSFALTGTTVALRHGYPLAIGSGSFSLSGSNVGLKCGRNIAAASASFPLTGSDVTLTYGGTPTPNPVFQWKRVRRVKKYGISGRNSRSIRIQTIRNVPIITTAPVSGSKTLAIDSGSFSYTGSNVGLKRGYPISVGSANYPFTGSNVNLKYGHKIQADTANYPYTGSNVGLKRGYPIVVGSGSFSLSGSSVRLVSTHTLSIGSANYPFNGSDVDLFYSGSAAHISVGSGSFSFSGSNVGLVHKSILSIGSVNYPFSGSSVSLKHASRLPINSGSFTYSGSDVSIDHGYKIPVGSGAYSYIGSSVGLYHTSNLTVGLGSYAFNGSSVGLRRSYPLVVGVGNYLYIGSGELFDSLQGYYKFNSNPLDESGRHHDLTGSIDIAYVSGGVSGDCLSFGSASITGLNIVSNGLTVAASVKRTFAFGTKTIATLSPLIIEYVSSGTKIQFRTDLASISITIPVNTWKKCILTTDGNGTASAYLDSVLVGTINCGVGPFTTNTWVFSGASTHMVDDGAIWSRNLSLAEIRIIGNGTNQYDLSESVILRYGHSILGSSGTYGYQGSEVTLTYVPLRLPGGYVSATITFGPTVLADCTYTVNVDGNVSLQPLVSALVHMVSR